MPDSSFRSESDGSFQFRFPAPAMNAVYFRVVGANGSTPAYLFKTKHQDADLTIAEESPLPSDAPLPRGFAVLGERYEIAVDTAPDSSVSSRSRRPAACRRLRERKCTKPGPGGPGFVSGLVDQP